MTIRSSSKEMRRLGDELSAKDFDEIIVPVGGGGLISGISKGLCRNGIRQN